MSRFTLCLSHHPESGPKATTGGKFGTDLETTVGPCCFAFQTSGRKSTTTVSFLPSMLQSPVCRQCSSYFACFDDQPTVGTAREKFTSSILPSISCVELLLVVSYRRETARISTCLPPGRQQNKPHPWPPSSKSHLPRSTPPFQSKLSSQTRTHAASLSASKQTNER